MGDDYVEAIRWDFKLLNHGQHFRFNEQTKIVVGRNARDNAALRLLASREDAPKEAARLVPEGFRGPHALLVGRVTAPALAWAAALRLRYARRDDRENARVCVRQFGGHRVIPIQADEAARSAATL